MKYHAGIWSIYFISSLAYLLQNYFFLIAPIIHFCLRQPHGRTNARHGILFRELWQSLFKSLDRDEADTTFSAILMAGLNAMKLVRLDFFLHGSQSDLYLVYHA